MADAVTAATAASTTASTAASTGLSSSRTALAGNFDSFLQLLTTQLKNQSPLDPLDTNQFTQQLVQFASVEQQLRSNDTLNALLTSVKASATSNAASFLGMQVTADGATTRLSGGKTQWTINPARAATQATIAIRDKSGSLVASQTKALAAGPQSFAWDGRTSTGTLAPDGDYTITVTARDASGQAISVKTEVSGKVDSVDMSGDAPELVIGSTRVPLANVKGIGLPASN
jgi:flagellar basal-body rod modification protein FlgD